MIIYLGGGSRPPQADDHLPGGGELVVFVTPPSLEAMCAPSWIGRAHTAQVLACAPGKSLLRSGHSCGHARDPPERNHGGNSEVIVYLSRRFRGVYLDLALG